MGGLGTVPELSMNNTGLARIMHKFSTAAAKSSGVLQPPALRVTRLVRPALSPLRDKNLCISRASRNDPGVLRDADQLTSL